MVDEMKEVTFYWFIENYSYCWHDSRENLVSPDFTPDQFQGTSWNLLLYPRGNAKIYRSQISLFLVRKEHDNGPDKFPVKYELSVVTANGSPIKTLKNAFEFSKNNHFGAADFIFAEEILVKNRSECLPQDTLKLRCRMWWTKGMIERAGQYTAQTRIGIEKISFFHKVRNFSAMKPNKKKTVHIQSHSKTRCVISSSLYLTKDSCCKGKIFVEISPSDGKYVLREIKLFLLNGSEDNFACGEADIRFDAIKTYIKKLPMSLTRDVILGTKTQYLSNDELSLICECTFSTGIEFEKIEETLHALPVKLYTQIRENARNKDYNCVTEEMKAFYVNQKFTDIELQTKTEIFRAHKFILCARSSVFRAMFTNDMQEKRTNSIQIDDLENDIVHQFLLFLYSDNLVNLNWESAIKLYYAGDKYAVEKLKILCSSFLEENIGISTASKLLLLADTHNDSDLKNVVEDFILKHKEKIIDSKEWKNLGETNPELVIKMMTLMIKGRKAS